MAIMRAVVKGNLAAIVQYRNMFTADVVPSGGDTAEILWTAYLSSIYDEIKQIMANIVNIDGYDLYAPLGSQWELVQEVSWVTGGTISTDYQPFAVAAVLIGKAAGVRKMGRKFFGGIAESMTSGNYLTTAAMSQAALACLAYVTPFTGLGGGTITPGIRTQAGVFHPFVGGVVSSVLGSMRRRKPGVGI